MNSRLNHYLQTKQYAWSPSTIKSESSRLRRLLPLLDGNPQKLWEALDARKMASYTRTTTWVRVIDFWSSFNDSNPYKVFKSENARLFKNNYKRSTPQMTFREVEALLQTLKGEVRVKALDLLYTGMRYTESLTYRQGEVVGKGEKVRKVYREPQSTYSDSYHKFWKELRTVGLKPHMLRKVAATEFYNRGLSEVDLCKVMGWESFETARSYVAAKKDEKIKELLND